MKTREDLMRADTKELVKIAEEKLRYFTERSTFKVDGEITVPMLLEELKTRELPVSFSLGQPQSSDKKETEKIPSKKEKRKEFCYKTGTETERISIRVTKDTKEKFETFLAGKPTPFVYGDAALKSFLEAYEKRDLKIYLEA